MTLSNQPVNANSHDDRYLFIDLCAGIGGMRRGFEMTGKFRCVASAEIDETAARVYRRLFGDDPTGDFSSHEFKQKIKFTPYHVLVAGFPCQPFSVLGFQKGLLEEGRGTVFFLLADIIEHTRPRAVLLENVPGLLTTHAGDDFACIVETLHNIGYKILGAGVAQDGTVYYERDALVRNSRDFGVPQQRRRVYLMAFDRFRYGDKIAKLTPTPASSGRMIYRDLRDALELGADSKYYISQQSVDRYERYNSARIGSPWRLTLRNAPDVPYGDCYSLCLRPMNRNLGLGITVVEDKHGLAGQRATDKSKSPINDRELRFLTEREYGKLQGFINYAFMVDGKDTFSFPDGLSIYKQYSLFGNAVTIPVIESMAEYMFECLSRLDRRD